MTTGEHQSHESYTVRYCAFIDVLGFRELIYQLSRGALSAEMLRDLLRIVHESPRSEHVASFPGSDLRSQSISDAVCLSAASSPYGLAHLFYSIKQLARQLLETGFFVRGAIVKGRLYHDERTVFGEALVDAYRLESQVVRYPRIMVTKDVMEDTSRFLEQGYEDFFDSLNQSDDGPYHLHILRLMILRKTNDTRDTLAWNRTAKQIQRRYREAVDNPRDFEKVQWFAKYWNGTVSEAACEIDEISGPGLSSHTSL